ncbi:MAG: aminotransferase class V-fold PLP-dependent enzyme [Lachnospiraceae bacterium]|nr:aminotransferase class V-fold PLP-dependent enzyme [Lachnospiraceae bacterium]
MNNENKLSFSSDYMEGAHPDILKRLMDTNMEKSAGYGLDEYTESAKEKIREACGAPDADVYFLTGGTQANATMIDAMLRSYQGVMAAKSGHISVHEAGAIEFGGHKVLTLPENNGKITAGSVESCINSYKMDENNEHMIMPGMVYISHPTEFGTLYSLDELKALSDVCHKNDIPLYLDGARLAYALACPENDVRLRDIASLCDVFYIGGTKCGALFGEAVVIPKKGFIPHIFTIIKQHGALLAKGRIAGIQFETLFTNDLYYKIGQNAIDTAGRIKAALAEYGYEFAFNSPTNQIFVRLSREKSEELSEKIEMGFWENIDDSHVIMRIATSWATRQEDVDRLIEILKQ